MEHTFHKSKIQSNNNFHRSNKRSILSSEQLGSIGSKSYRKAKCSCKIKQDNCNKHYVFSRAVRVSEFSSSVTSMSSSESLESSDLVTLYSI